ncbi:granulocyte colony-stimulating factor [Austrofundulus limnaeus]|uniref:Granulocyte colony-stimulating factor-like n=1 Tax=Austrofundulus limnaeus TaxID=52670 RepID=A0A2I4B769_AUSLI|nr:PREDICTED: granulocyte colony-stimulating factor-like [Austrofundulus limnaeus]XP_013863584.1 PREDICTED: granulocyte colony-stimulating factor-like [Austrofundulus limnaeus]
MASTARGAPLPQLRSLVEDPHFQEILHRSRSLTQKVLLSIPDTHKSCIHTATLQLNSSENVKLETMASILGIPPAPGLRAISENFTLESSLRRMHEGLLLHRGLLSSVSPRLEVKTKVADLMDDIRDVAVQITKMLKMVQPEAAVQSTTAPLSIHLPGDYEVQVATHLTLVQLQSFGQDMVRVLRSLEQSDEEEEENDS